MQRWGWGPARSSQRSMMINTLDLQSTELVYVAEGNANIVLKLTKLKQVLRLPKLEKSKGGGDHELFCYLHRSVKYISILADMCGHEFIFLPRIVKIPEDEAKRINEFITNFRPVNRLGKEFNGKYAMLMQDATAGSTSEPIYSVEIKPKQGWIFDNTIDHIFRLQGVKRCRYCCMQYLKMKMEKISSRSKYCPMDLFSGNVNRMRKAIEAILYEPQNNLRIFKNWKSCI
ncbi:unnamed protein product [Hermetia illucens]|uniref:Inositol-pentakisphosphate 2-kinase n=2 Tax=Hermetia illucens TaxID=343691 RepID=A0A7R8UD49_HERIL|nr:unnamed protein product [Hermetia illucens]